MDMKQIPKTWGRLAGGLLLAAAALAGDGSLDTAHSSIVATFRQENVPVDAPFRKFSGAIHYDAANVATASAVLNVDTGSFDIGDESYNAEVRKLAWFDSTHFPQATFRSTAIKAGAPGHFDATGTLSIKGRAQTITVAISVLRNGKSEAFDGAFDLSRKAFGIGDPGWDDVLDDKVHVRFHLQNATP
jgi:polyisoprenoid-binding protein YceI